MPHSVTGIVDASRYCLVTHIDGIATSLRDGGQIGSHTLVALVIYGLNLAHTTCHEGILTIEIETIVEGESCRIGFCPMVHTLCLLIHTSVASWRVVIYNHLLALPVSFTGCKHDSPSTLQHRDEIRHHDGLGEQILTGAEEWGTLPFPDAVSEIIIDAVTCPHTEVTILQTVGDGIGQRGVLYPRLTFIAYISPYAGRIGVTQIARGNQLAEFPTTTLDAELIILTTVGHQSLYIIIYILYSFGCETGFS